MVDKWVHRVSFKSALESFLSSQHPIRIIQSLPSVTKPTETTRPTRPRRLYILDSSFNPPTVAHLDLLLTALASNPPTIPQHILLLLATKNADKPVQPAPFEHRLCMMELLTSDLLARVRDPAQIRVDLGLTKLPYFVDKAAALEACNVYKGAEQVHLVGFDTLTRILDPKYYPPTHTLVNLVPFLEKHQLHVISRVGNNPDKESQQNEYVRAIAEGSLDSVAGRREWVSDGRIQLVSGTKGTVSSTRVREAVKRRDWETVQNLTTPAIWDWISRAPASYYLDNLDTA